MRRPPKLAFGLLKLLAPERDELVGDLTEAFRNSHSRWWYWRQVVGAIFVGAIRTSRAHPFGVARGLIVGWIVMWTLSHYVAPQILRLDEVLFVIDEASGVPEPIFEAAEGV